MYVLVCALEWEHEKWATEKLCDRMWVYVRKKTREIDCVHNGESVFRSSFTLTTGEQWLEGAHVMHIYLYIGVTLWFHNHNRTVIWWLPASLMRSHRQSHCDDAVTRTLTQWICHDMQVCVCILFHTHTNTYATMRVPSVFHTRTSRLTPMRACKYVCLDEALDTCRLGWVLMGVRRCALLLLLSLISSYLISSNLISSNLTPCRQIRTTRAHYVFSFHFISSHLIYSI